ncbi:MAG: peptidyl-prolyl cis-trans isomerase [Bdellovibrionaceae bacterium]|nr:peptidyl-prolyl cis-trans isomerase [Pseudobdellovibrionaceae bacterium]
MKSELEGKEEVRARHILIKFNPADPEAEAKTLEKARDLRRQAERGDFAALAKSHSEDPGSKSKGGDLGYFSRGKMVPEFEAVAFSLKPGEVSEPVKTSFGWHIIQVLDRREPKTATFDEHREKAMERVLALDRAQQLIRSLEEAIKSDPSRINSVLTSAGLKWEETGFFSLDVDSVPKLSSEALSSAALSLTPDKKLYPQMLVDAGAQYILSLKEEKTVPVTLGASELETLGREQADSAFSIWLAGEMKRARIETQAEALR